MTGMTESIGIPIVYLVSAVLFILGLKQLSHPRTAPRGNQTAAIGMFLAVVATLVKSRTLDYPTIIAGVVVGALVGGVAATKVQMTAIPQLVAMFNGFGGGASLLVATAEYNRQATLGIPIEAGTTSTIFLSILIGGVTFSGSLIAFAKLQGIMRGAPVLFSGRHVINATLAVIILAAGAYAIEEHQAGGAVIVGIAGSLVLGILMVIPIGGADMPVVISLLNSFSGVAAAATGFVIDNMVLIISGSLVGASGIILTNIMCKGMNRTVGNVLFGGVGSDGGTAAGAGTAAAGKAVKSYEPEDTVVLFENARKVMIVPGYGMAVAQAQHVVHELEKVLEKKGTTVKYAIHPVAGRMPGHMNVLLAEASVDYEKQCDLEQSNPEFEDADIAIVIGANDVVNPAARNNKSSPIYGMPILDVDRSQTVFVLKRSMSPGFAGIDNELFYNDNTIMIFGDAKDTVSKLVAELQ